MKDANNVFFWKILSECLFWGWKWKEKQQKKQNKNKKNKFKWKEIQKKVK